MSVWSRSLSVVLCASLVLWTVGCGDTASNTEDVVTITSVEGDGATPDKIASQIIVTGTNFDPATDQVEFRDATTGEAKTGGVGAQVVTPTQITVDVDPDTFEAGATKTIVSRNAVPKAIKSVTYLTGPGLMDGDTEGQILVWNNTSLAWELGTGGGGGGGTVDSVVAGEGVTVDATDPANPIVKTKLSSTGGLDNTLGTGSDELGIISGLVDGQVLKWNGTSSAWELGTDNLGGTGSGTVDSVLGGDGIVIDATDVSNPIVDVDVSATDGLSVAVGTGQQLGLVSGDIDGQILKWNGSFAQWELATDETGGAGGGQVDAITGANGIVIDSTDPTTPEVSLPTGTDGQVMKWSAGTWVAGTDDTGVGGTPTGTVLNDMLFWDTSGTPTWAARQPTDTEIPDDISISNGLLTATSGGTYIQINTGAGEDLTLTEGGLGPDSSNPETFTFENTDTGTLSVAVEGTIQAGSTTTAVYNRLGGGTTGHGLADVDDLLVTDALEVDGAIYADGNVTVAGTLTLNVDPTADLEAATKQYVDNNAGGRVDSITGANGIIVGGTAVIPTITLPAGSDGQVLKWSGGAWAAGADSVGGASVGTITDVLTSAVGADTYAQIDDDAPSLYITNAGTNTGTADAVAIYARATAGSGAIALKATGPVAASLTGAVNVTGNVSVSGVVQAGGTTAVAFNRLGSGVTDHPAAISGPADLLVSDALEVNGNVFADGNADVAGDLDVVGRISVGSGADAFNDYIFFDGDTKGFLWDEGDQHFKIEGTLMLAGTGASVINTFRTPVPYNAFGPTATTSHGLTNASDVFVVDQLEVDGVTYADGGLTAAGTVQMPQFQDTDNVNYIVNPSGISVLSSVRLDTDVVDAPNTTLTQTGIDVLNTTADTTFTIENSADPQVVNVAIDGNLNVGGDVRAARYYDVSGFVYYIDPAAQSNLNLLAVSNSLTMGGLTTAAYNRAGTGTTNRGLNDGADLLVSNDLEVDHDIFADGDVYVAGALEVGGEIVSLDGHTHALGDLSNVTATAEGSGGGFDADTVDNVHASSMVQLTNSQSITGLKTFAPSSYSYPFAVGSTETSLVNYLNADMVDSLHGASFLRSDAVDSYTAGTLTFNAGTTLQVNGTLAVAATTRFLSIPGSAFHPDDDNINYYITTNPGYIHGQTPGQNVDFYAALNLPHGATLVNMKAVVDDDDGLLAETVGAGVLRTYDNGIQWLSSPQYTDTVNGTSLIVNVPISASIDNENNAYAVRVLWTVPAVITQKALRYVSVEYTVTSPLP